MCRARAGGQRGFVEGRGWMTPGEHSNGAWRDNIWQQTPLPAVRHNVVFARSGKITALSLHPRLPSCLRRGGYSEWWRADSCLARKAKTLDAGTNDGSVRTGRKEHRSLAGMLGAATVRVLLKGNLLQRRDATSFKRRVALNVLACLSPMKVQPSWRRRHSTPDRGPSLSESALDMPGLFWLTDPYSTTLSTLSASAATAVGRRASQHDRSISALHQHAALADMGPLCRNRCVSMLTKRHRYRSPEAC